MSGTSFVETWTADPETGPDLEFDRDYIALGTAAAGKAEQQYGDTIVAAEEPNWREIEQAALELLGRSRDIRIIVHLGIARLRTKGLAGYAECVALIARLLESHWETVHPRLDPEDDNDPTMRANAVLAIADPGRVLRALRDVELTRAPRGGRLTWRQIGHALHLLEGEAEEDTPTEAAVQSAFAESDPAFMEALRATVAGLVKDLKAIGAAFDDKSGYGNGPDLSRLEKFAADVNRTLLRFAAAEAPAGDAAAEGEPGGGVDGGGDAVAGATPVARRGGGSFASVQSLTSVATRQDALHLLDVACRYYEANEPSSPTPLLVRRALRLSEMNFLDILRELAPDGVSQAATIVGTPPE